MKPYTTEPIVVSVNGEALGEVQPVTLCCHCGDRGAVRPGQRCNTCYYTKDGLCCVCGEHRITRPRQLCNACYFDPELRKLAPNGNASHARDVMQFKPRPLPLPTSALPGSEEKMEVLALRLELGLELYHPDDAKADEE